MSSQSDQQSPSQQPQQQGQESMIPPKMSAHYYEQQSPSQQPQQQNQEPMIPPKMNPHYYNQPQQGQNPQQFPRVNPQLQFFQGFHQTNIHQGGLALPFSITAPATSIAAYSMNAPITPTPQQSFPLFSSSSPPATLHENEKTESAEKGESKGGEGKEEGNSSHGTASRKDRKYRVKSFMSKEPLQLQDDDDDDDTAVSKHQQQQHARTQSQQQSDDVIADSLRSLVAKLKKEKDEIKAEAERYKTENEMLRSRVRTLEEQNFRVKDEHKKEIKALNDELRIANKSLKDAYAPQSIRDESIKDELYTLKTAQKALNEENELLRTYISLMQESAGYMKTQKENLEAEVKVLRECVAKFRGAVALFATNFTGYFNACTAELPGPESEHMVTSSHSAYASCEGSLKTVNDRMEAVQQDINKAAQRSNERAVSKEMWQKRYADLCASGDDPFGKDLYPAESAGPEDDKGSDGGQENGVSMTDLLDQVIGINSIFNGQLMRDFCMMHKTFADSETIFKMIGYKFKCTLFQKDQKDVLIAQTKIVNFVQKWIENFPRDFQTVAMQSLAYMFTHSLLDGNKILSDLVLKVLARPVPNPPPAPTQPAPTDAPAISLQLLDLNPAELAKQITLLDYSAFVRISYVELVDPKNWTSEKEGGIDPALNVRASIKRFNRMTSWVQTEILSRESVKDRAAVLRYFILLEKEFLNLNNFSSVMAIALAFRTAAIVRLHQTFDYLNKKLLSKKEKAMYDELCALTSESKNWMNFRKAMETAQVPCIPHIGILLGDIQFATDGMEEHVKGGLNFAKKRKIASIINSIINSQPTPYTFPIDANIRLWFTTVPVYEQSQAFEISKRLESPNGGGSAALSSSSASSSSSGTAASSSSYSSSAASTAGSASSTASDSSVSSSASSSPSLAPQKL